jgi:hypothetical protein
MNILILLLATQITLHAAPGDVEARLMLRAIHHDLYVVDEDTGVMRHYQTELRKIVAVRTPALDTFVSIGRHKAKLPLTALDNPYWTVLAIKREIDLYNAEHRAYAERTDEHETAKYAGIIDLGDEGRTADELPQPWKAEYRWTVFQPPTIER